MRMMSDDATVYITDVFPDAEVVKASTLRVGDTVFDVWGGRYTLAEVYHHHPRVHTVRSDGWPNVWLSDETLTVIRGGE
jgi:uncharacterized UPF0160 family protein